MKRTVSDSSSRVNSTAEVAGVTCQPDGASMVTVAVEGPLFPLVTTARISRALSAPPAGLRAVAPAAGPTAGTMAMSGVTVAENRGTTCSSIRFSPLKMFPSYR